VAAALAGEDGGADAKKKKKGGKGKK